MLDDAMGNLGEMDRNAVVLRFFENKSAAQVAGALKISEAAANKRMSRALEKLRKFFSKRGVSSTTAIISGVISIHSVQVAPAAIAKSVTLAAAAKGAAASGSLLTLANGALKAMAWTKAKMAVAAGVTIILAAGTATVVIKTTVAAATPSSKDLSWADDPKYWQLDFGNADPQQSMKTMNARTAAFEKRINSLPPVLILRPTRFRTNLGYMGSNDKVLARGSTLSALIQSAYDAQIRMLLPTNFPNDKFDLMLTLPNHGKEALQQEIKNRFGFVAHIETIETNILILRVKSSDAPAPQPTKGGLPSYPTRSPQNKIDIKNQELAGVAACFSAILKERVVNETGIKDRYDVSLQWQVKPGETSEDAFKRTVFEQLGLEFVPDRKSFQYLVVQKVP